MFQINYKLLSLALFMLTVVIMFQCADKRDQELATSPAENITPETEDKQTTDPPLEIVDDAPATMEATQVDLSETISKLNEVIADLKEVKSGAHGDMEIEVTQMVNDLQLEKEKLTRRAELLTSAEQDEQAEVITTISGAIQEVRGKIDKAENLVDDAEESV